MFVDRVGELGALKARLDSKGFEFIVLYGRRRQGKTTLIYEAAKGRDAVFYCGSKNNNLGKFKQAAGLAHLADDWEVLFSALKGRILVLDEFPYILEEDPDAGYALQKVVDHVYKDSGTKLVLCGSVVSVLKENVLEYNAPLYGRKTAQMKLKPMRFIDAASFYKGVSFEGLVKAYSFSGGVPQYARMVEFPFEQWLNKEVSREDSLLVDEVEFIVKSEFKKEKSYFSILEAISLGKNSFWEIREHGRFKETDITPYLNNLKYAELIDAEAPVLGGKKSSRYVINDWFTQFWFNFIYPHRFEIDVKKYALDGKAFNSYLGPVFEDVARQFFAEDAFAAQLGFTPEKFGRQWGRIPQQFKPEKGKDQYEIDVVALNEKNKEILFAECKWRERADAAQLAKELNEKTRFVDWHNGKRRETLALFAKSFSKRTSEVEGKPVKCFDLNDLQKIMGRLPRKPPR